MIKNASLAVVAALALAGPATAGGFSAASSCGVGVGACGVAAGSYVANANVVAAVPYVQAQVVQQKVFTVPVLVNQAYVASQAQVHVVAPAVKVQNQAVIANGAYGVGQKSGLKGRIQQFRRKVGSIVAGPGY